jgi:mRNA-degrading endonuclease RelE of RelBE toxin-antitoxin system
VPERSVRLAAGAQTAIRSMHSELRRRVRATFDRIRTQPEAGKPLLGDLTGWWSIRVGRIRIVYRSTRGLLEVAAIGPRTSIYEYAVRLVRPKP